MRGGATKRRRFQTRHNKLGLHKIDTRGKHETGQTRPDQAMSDQSRVANTDRQSQTRPDLTWPEQVRPDQCTWYSTRHDETRTGETTRDNRPQCRTMQCSTRQDQIRHGKTRPNQNGPCQTRQSWTRNQYNPTQDDTLLPIQVSNSQGNLKGWRIYKSQLIQPWAKLSCLPHRKQNLQTDARHK